MSNETFYFIFGAMLGGVVMFLLFAGVIMPLERDFGIAGGYCSALGYEYETTERIGETFYCIDTTGTLPTIEAQLP